MRKSRLGDGPSEPAAILIRGEEDFGTVRMYNQWLEAMGVRSESDTLVCEDLEVALRWLEEVTVQPGLADAILRHWSASSPKFS